MDRVREQQRFLSSLWIFASLNYLYCDVIGLMDSNMLRQYLKGEVNDFTINDNFLLAATALMEVPMSMIVLSTALNPKASRIANVAAGALMTVVQAGTLFTGKPTSYYAFSSGVEIATTSFIAVYSLFFMKPPKVTPILEVKHDGLAVKAGFAF